MQLTIPHPRVPKPAALDPGSWMAERRNGDCHATRQSTLLHDSSRSFSRVVVCATSTTDPRISRRTPEGCAAVRARASII